MDSLRERNCDDGEKECFIIKQSEEVYGVPYSIAKLERLFNI
jgi:hypothetical protein